jgi:DNA-binding FadR family transcriptional regulator
MFDVRQRPAPVTVGRITAPKASDVLAAELRERIRSGAWPEGQALPTERALSEQSGLSRMTVREALRMLEIDGLIEIRPGRGGGARVRRPEGEELTRQLELFIWGRNIGVEHLHDVREALEALGAHGAALRRTEADLAELVARTEAVEAAVDQIGRYLDANLAWHMAVIRASHNELLVSFMQVLSNAIHRATESEAYDSRDVRQATLRIHRAILAAIVAGDAEAARRRMARHVHAAHDLAIQWEADRGAAPAPRKPRAGKPPRTARKRNRTKKEAK